MLDYVDPFIVSPVSKHHQNNSAFEESLPIECADNDDSKEPLAEVVSVTEAQPPDPSFMIKLASSLKRLFGAFVFAMSAYQLLMLKYDKSCSLQHTGM